MAYLITYDLMAPGKDYNNLYAAIKKLGGYWHHFSSVWIVTHPGPASVIYNMLVPHIDRNDKLMVIHCDNDWTAWGLNQKAADWLQTSL